MITKGIRSVSSTYTRGDYIVEFVCSCRSLATRETLVGDIRVCNGRSYMLDGFRITPRSKHHVARPDAWKRYVARNP